MHYFVRMLNITEEKKVSWELRNYSKTTFYDSVHFFFFFFSKLRIVILKEMCISHKRTFHQPWDIISTKNLIFFSICSFSCNDSSDGLHPNPSPCLVHPTICTTNTLSWTQTYGWEVEALFLKNETFTNNVLGIPLNPPRCNPTTSFFVLEVHFHKGVHKKKDHNVQTSLILVEESVI